MISWLADELRLHLRRAYPAFVYGHGPADLEDGYVPVFTFHTLVPHEFEAHLRYLSANGYRTITLDRLLAHLRCERPLPERAVVLTIDDGRASTWRVGLPLLQRYDMRATAFVIPGYTENGPPRATLEDDSHPQSPTEASESHDRKTSLRWSELKSLENSDFVSVESHTLTHKRVTVSRKLVGFVTPDWSGARFDLPAPLHVTSAEEAKREAHRLGTPIFEHRPLLAVSEALEVPEELVHRCTEHVARRGGVHFFERRGWRRELDRIVDRAPGRFRRVPTEPHQQRELRESKRRLEAQLRGKRVRHLCLPSGAGTDAVSRLAREAGYETVCWGFRRPEESNRAGADPLTLGRIKCDYIPSLPGKGRENILDVLARKARRRLRGRSGH